MWTYVQDLSGDPADVIAEAFTDKSLAPRRNPDIQQVSTIVMKTVKARAIKRAHEIIQKDADEVFGNYTSVNGDYENVAEETRGDYESGLDDAAEKLLEPYDAYISANWYGINTIDTRLWESLAIYKWCASAAKEIFKEMTYGKTPVQVMSNAGITNKMMQEALDANATSTTQEETSMTIENLDDVAKRVAQTIGKGYDVMNLDAEVNAAQDTDAVVANAAGARIGLDPSATMILQMACIEHGDALTDVLIGKVDEALAAEKPKKKKPARNRKKTADDTPPVDAVDTRVMVAIKGHSSAKDNDVAEGVLNVSRGTFNSYVKGASHFIPEGNQINDLRNLLLHDINPLLEALALLDGTTPTVVA